MICSVYRARVGVGDGHAVAQRGRVDVQVPHAPLFRHAVLRLVGLEVRRDLGLARRHAGLVGVGVEQHEIDFDLLVTLAVLGLDVGVGDRHPRRERVAELVGLDLTPHLALEVLDGNRRRLRRQNLAVALIADELPVLLEGRQPQDPLAQLRVAHLDAEPIGFGEHRFLVDHLTEDALLDAELPQHLIVQIAAVRLPVGLHLLVIGALKGADFDLAPFDGGHRGVGRRAGARRHPLLRNVNQHERDDYEAEAPFEPPFVPAHPIEHSHVLETLRENTIILLELLPPLPWGAPRCAAGRQGPRMRGPAG